MTILTFGLMVALASVGTATAQAVVNVNAGYSYEMLDPTVDVNRKQLRLLEKRQEGVLENDSVTLGAAFTGIADYQRSDTAGKFGYLMRHPTSNN